MQESYSIPIQTIDLECLHADGLKLTMARIDEIHKLASGNKIYKLNPIINYAKDNNFRQILSFGGAYSNHIHALALMAKQNDIEAIAIIRGESEYAENPTLSDTKNAGMKLEFVNRQEYKKRNDDDYLASLQSRYPEALIIGEGGISELAIHGCAIMAQDINRSFTSNKQSASSNDNHSDILAVASGTGATAIGLIKGLAKKQKLIAYPVLKDESLVSRIDRYFNDNSNEDDNDKSNEKQQQYTIQNADFGGYAKIDKALLDFILSWLAQTGILLDPIYTSKMCRRVIQQIEAGDFSQGESITLIHSGGLQGWRGMQSKVESISGKKAWDQISRHLEKT